MDIGQNRVNILFFAHNRRHYKFFSKVTEIIKNKKKASYQCRVITDSEYIPNDSSENLNLRILNEMNLQKDLEKELERIKSQYPDFNLLGSILGDRGLNYFPRFLGLKKISRYKQEAYTVAAFKVFERELEAKPTDLIISELIIGLQDAVLYSVAKRKNIGYVGLRASKLGTGVVFCDPYTEIPLGFQQILNKFALDIDAIPLKHLNFANKHLKDLRSKYSIPVYMHDTAKSSKYIERHYLRRFFEVFVSMLRYKNKSPFFQLNFLQLIKYRLIRILNTWQLRSWRGKLLFSDPGDLEGKKFLIFPLQFEPEATTLVRSYPYTDQIYLAKQISKLLPDDMYLAVKEHRGNEGYRKIKDYKELCYEPNIILLPRIMDVGKLIRDSCGVITMSGRMGWEALVLNKPVFSLGRAFWTRFRGVRKLNSLEDIRLHYANIGSSTDDNNYTVSDLLAYTSAYHSKTFDGIFIGKSPMLLEPSNLNKVADSICLFIENQHL